MSQTILDVLADCSRKRVEAAKILCPALELKERAESLPKGNRVFDAALRKSGISVICEVKKASPSKGLIAKEFPYVEISQDYEEAGASAISVLTEPEFFLGQNRYLQEIRNAVSIPLLRKDFTVDEYQIHEAKLMGADAVLLICSLLPVKTLHSFLSVCDTLGISALVEAHTEEEIQSALYAGAHIIGVNNRNLKTFEVDFERSLQLRDLIPPEVLFVAESGVKTSEDFSRLRKAGADAVLVGETLMRADDKKQALIQLTSE